MALGSGTRLGVYEIVGSLGAGGMGEVYPSIAFSKAASLPLEGVIQRGQHAYDITPDGKQFLVILSPSEIGSGDAPTFQIDVMLNWLEDLKQRVPIKN